MRTRKEVIFFVGLMMIVPFCNMGMLIFNSAKISEVDSKLADKVPRDVYARIEILEESIDEQLSSITKKTDDDRFRMTQFEVWLEAVKEVNKGKGIIFPPPPK